ncbi:MAG: DM9 repeat-containing protein [Alphaproteobacteria bacterium]
MEKNLAVCSASYKGGWHPGKVVSGKCNIGWGGKERVIRTFQVLTTKGAKFSWSKNKRAKNQVVGGKENGRSLYVCRAYYKGGSHPGKVVSGKCNIGWGGKEIKLSSYEVLTSR